MEMKDKGILNPSPELIAKRLVNLITEAEQKTNKSYFELFLQQIKLGYLQYSISV